MRKRNLFDIIVEWKHYNLLINFKKHKQDKMVSGFGGGRGAPRGRGGPPRGGFGDRGGGRGGGRGAPRGRGGPRGGGRGGARGGIGAGAKVLVQPHERFQGVYVLRGKDDALVTKNLTPGESVYNEKRVSVEVSSTLI